MPAKDNVIIRMSAEEAGVVEAWRKAKEGPEAMAKAIEDASNRGRRHTDQMAQSLEHMVGKWVSVHAGIEAVKKTFEQLIEFQREFEQNEAKASQTADAAMRKYFVTARIASESQQQAVTRRIGDVAIRQRTGLPAAGAAAELLTRFGVSRGEAEGASLEELLKLQTATQAGGGDADAFSRRVLEIIRRSTPGGKITPQAIGKVGATMRQLTGSDLGFGDQAFELYAKFATILKSGGYDESTGMALTAAISEKYDPRAARSVIREIAKPGMQKGEAELLARARGALGRTSGVAEYEEAVDIGRESIASMIAEGQTGATLAKVGEKKLTTEQIKERLLAVVRASGASEGEFKAAEFTYEHPFLWTLPATLLSDEQRANWALSQVRPSRFDSSGAREQAYQRIIGLQPLAPPMTIRIKGQDGRDVPHQSEAAGIQSR